MRKRCFIISLVILLSVNAVVFAGITGKISGRVLDAKGGAPLPGVNVLIKGTNLGAATNTDGNYFIINVPPGTYNVVFSMMGYKNTTVTDVRVKIDQTTVVDFKLEEEIVEGEEVTIVALRPIIELDLTASKTVMTGKDIQESWASNIVEAIQVQDGVNIHGGIRGGWGLDVTYLVDGMDLRDGGSNSNYKGLNLTTVQEMEVLTGGWNAEYGQANGAIVNVITKSASDRIRGSINYRIRPAGIYHWGGHLYGADRFDRTVMTTEAFWDPNQEWIDYEGETHKGNNGGWPQYRNMTPAERAAWWAEFAKGDPVQANYDKRAQWELEGTLFGPINSKMNYLISGRWKEGVLRFPASLPYSPEWNAQAKLSYQVTKNSKIVFSGIYGGFINAGNPKMFYNSSEDSWPRGQTPAPYITNPYDRDKYWLVGVFNEFLRPPEYVDMITGQAKLTHIFNEKSYLEFSAGYYHMNYRNDFDDILKSAYLPGSNVPTSNEIDPIPNTEFKFKYGQPGDLFRNSAELKNHSIKADFVSQITKVHQLKAGILFSYQYFDRKWQFGTATEAYLNHFVKTDFNPYEGASYIQDKIELKGMIVNAGLRLDFFNVNKIISKDFWDPYRLGANTPGNIAPGIVSFDPNHLDPRYDRKTPTRYAISPRLGISHPISDNTVLHFMYGHFNMRPSWMKLGQAPILLTNELPENLDKTFKQFPKDTKFSYHQWSTNAGNPALTWEKMIQYEVGVDQNIADLLSLGITLYYKNAKDLTSAGFRQGRMESSNTSGEIETPYGQGLQGGQGSHDQENVYTKMHPDPNDPHSKIPGKTIGNYVISSNGGFADVRGLEATIETKFTRHFKVRLMYNMSYTTKGRYGYMKYFKEFDEGKLADDMPFDVGNEDGGFGVGSNEYWNPHNSLKLVASLNTPSKFGPAIRAFRPFGNWYINIFSEWSQGRRFTYHSPDDPSTKPLNRRWKDRYRTNMKLGKTIEFMKNLKAELSIEVLNLFNNKTLRILSEDDALEYFENDKLPVNEITKEPLVWNWYSHSNYPREIYFAIGLEF